MMHLAQVNVARMRGNIKSFVMSGLAARIDEMNRLAEGSPGFVWRLREEEIAIDDLHLVESYVVPSEADRLFYNMSVWESIEHLEHFVLDAAHRHMLRERQAWLEKFDRPAVALWWTPCGNRPSIAESVDKLWALYRNGPTPDAFTFKQRFGVPLT